MHLLSAFFPGFLRASFRPAFAATSFFALFAAASMAPALRAQTDEIQVYTGELAEVGEFTLTWHNNYTPDGARSPAYPGAVISNHSLNGVPEYAYGATEWLELGMYLPVYTVTQGHVLTESAKLRMLFAVPDADKKAFFYGINFELSHNAHRWEESRTSGEIRPIIGVRSGPWDFIFNPILDTAFDGLSHLDFQPATRLAYNISNLHAVAIEHYTDLGEVHHLLPASEQHQSLFLVYDFKGKTGVEFGVGHGLNDATDKWTVKLMFDWSLGKVKR